MTEEIIAEDTTAKFRRYNHVERLGHYKVDGIDIGKVHIFPKLDGTNSSVWWTGEGLGCGPVLVDLVG